MTKGIIALILLVASVATAQPAPKPLSDAQFDAQFRCPESYPTLAERTKEADDFEAWAKAAHPDWKINKMMAFRTKLLKEHHCVKSLQAHQQAQKARKAK